MELKFTLQLEIIEISQPKKFSDKFTKSELIGKTDEKYPNYFKVEFINDFANAVTRYRVGDLVTIDASLQGKKWEKDGKVSYFTSVVGKGIESSFPSVETVSREKSASFADAAAKNDDSLPF